MKLQGGYERDDRGSLENLKHDMKNNSELRLGWE